MHYIDIEYQDGIIVKNINVDFSIEKHKLIFEEDAASSCTKNDSATVNTYDTIDLNATRKKILKSKASVTILENDEEIAIQGTIVGYYCICGKHYIDLVSDEGKVYEQIEITKLLHDKNWSFLGNSKDNTLEDEFYDDLDFEDEENIQNIFNVLQEELSEDGLFGASRKAFSGCFGEDDYESVNYDYECDCDD